MPQAVVIDGARGTRALDRSGELVRGFWWRTFGLLVASNLAAVIPGLVLVTPFEAIASSTDREVWSLVGTVATETITAPFVALFSTLLYYDLRRAAARWPREERSPGRWPGEHRTVLLTAVAVPAQHQLVREGGARRG